MSADQRLLDMERLYRETKNPLYVWWAISLRLPLNGGAIPEWCLEYLDDCAESLSNLAFRNAESTTKKAESVAATMGFTKRGINAFERFSANARDVAAAALYEKEKAAFGSESALSKVKSRLGKDRSTVARHAAEGRKLLPIRERAESEPVEQTTPAERAAYYLKMIDDQAKN